MKLINSIQGSVGIIISPDEVLPSSGVVLGNLLKLIGDAYKFAIRPQLPQITAPDEIIVPQYVFQSGALEAGQETLPVGQLVLLPTGGDLVTATTTEIAERVLDDLMARLDRELGYRFASSTSKRKVYLSNIVVEFDPGLEAKIEALGKIEKLLTQEIPRKDVPFKIKRLTFGFGRVGGTLGAIAPMVSLASIERSDFVIERRDPEPYTKNRYFCSAPVTTSEHIRILELVEKEML